MLPLRLTPPKHHPLHDHTRLGVSTLGTRRSYKLLRLTVGLGQELHEAAEDWASVASGIEVSLATRECDGRRVGWFVPLSILVDGFHASAYQDTKNQSARLEPILDLVV